MKQHLYRPKGCWSNCWVLLFYFCKTFFFDITRSGWLLWFLLVVLMSSEWRSSEDQSMGPATYMTNHISPNVTVMDESPTIFLNLFQFWLLLLLVVDLLIQKFFLLKFQKSFLPMFPVLLSENCWRWNQKLPSSGEKFYSDRKTVRKSSFFPWRINSLIKSTH